MGTFHYKATNAQGHSIEDTVESDSLSNARALLQEQGLSLLEIYEEPSPVSWSPVWHSTDTNAAKDSDSVDSSSDEDQFSSYFPIVDTLRLYSGWLLAWYALVYAFGYYQSTRDLPFALPFVDSLYLSPLVLSFTFGAYLFLLFSGWYVLSERKKSFGFVLTVVGIGVFILYRANV